MSHHTERMIQPVENNRSRLAKWTPVGSILASFLILMVFTLNARPAEPRIVDRVVAIVNQEIITLSELKVVRAQLESPLFGEFSGIPLTSTEEGELQEVLRMLIEKKLQLQAARKKGITVEQEELNRALDQIRTKQGIRDEATFEEMLARANLTLSDYTQEVSNQIKIIKLIDQEIRSSVILREQELSDYYQNHLDQFTLPEQVHLAQLLLLIPKNASPSEIAELEQEAREIRDQILRGMDFALMAKQHSDGREASQGGDLGIFKKGELIAKIENAVYSLRAGEVSEVVRTDLGFHIFKLIDKKQMQSVSFEEAKNQVQEKLVLERTQMAYTLWLKRLRDQSFVEVRM